MEWLATLFLGMFLFGLLFCAATVLIGLGHGSLAHLGPHHVGLGSSHGVGFGHGHGPVIGSHGAAGGSHGALGGGHGAAGGSDLVAAISPLNLPSLTAFVAWFGGIGYLALTDWQLAVGASLLLAIVAGLFGWGVIYVFFSRLLFRGEQILDEADFRHEGTVARVTMPIRAGGIGEIQYLMGGTHRSDGARSLDGSTIAKDTEVVIARYEGGLAFVQPWQEFVGGGETAPEGR